MHNDEILIVTKLFETQPFPAMKYKLESLIQVTGLCDIFINSISVGHISRDEDPEDDEASYSLSIPISLSSQSTDRTHNRVFN